MSPRQNPSLIPTDAPLWNDDEQAVFDDLYDDAEIEAICDALFPESLTKTPV